MANQGAWIGAGAAIVGALISAGVTLYISGGIDRKSELERDIQAGLQGLANVTEPERRLATLARIEQLLDFHEVTGWQRLVGEYREKAEADLQRLSELNQELEQQDAARDSFETAKGNLSQDESATLSAEIETVEATFEAERQAIIEARDALQSSILAAAAEQEEKRLAEEAQRAATAAQLQKELADQRICQDRNCTTWILP